MTEIKQRNAIAVNIDGIDEMQTAILQVRALICMTFGEAGGVFRGMHDDYQDGFMWAVADLIDKAHVGFEKMMDSRS